MMYRNAQRSFNGGGGGNEYYVEQSMLLNKENGVEDSPSGFSPGLLDLHSFDTELLPEVTYIFYCISSQKKSFFFGRGGSLGLMKGGEGGRREREWEGGGMHYRGLNLLTHNSCSVA